MQRKLNLLGLAVASACAGAMVSARGRLDELQGHERRALDGGGLMATIYGTMAKAAGNMPVDGRAITLVDTYAFTANPTAADELRLTRIPAGTYVDGVELDWTDIDTNGAPTFVYSAGYRPVSSADGSLAADTAYFAAAGQTTAQAGGRKYCNFAPIKFEQDVWLIITVGTASATFAAGSVRGIVRGSAVGPK